jgi:hypothetical protein
MKKLFFVLGLVVALSSCTHKPSAEVTTSAVDSTFVDSTTVSVDTTATIDTTKAVK